MAERASTTSTENPDRTSATLLTKVRDWRDDAAWRAFFDQYNPLLRFWCRCDGLAGDLADDLCQQIWIELMVRMTTFRYDPGRGFRRWLRLVFRSRAIDLARRRGKTAEVTGHLSVLDGASRWTVYLTPTDLEPDEDEEAESSALFRLAKSAQQTVRSRVDPTTWRAFEMIAIEDRTVSEVAHELGKKYTAVYNGFKRVDKMLRDEGKRGLGDRKRGTSDAASFD